MKYFLLIAAFAATADAALQCNPSDYKIWMPSFAQAFQSDTNSITTDCYITSVSYAGLFGDMLATGKAFKFSDWLAPVYKFQEMLVEATTVFSNCQTTNAAKQLTTRTTSFAGLFELFGTAGTAYVVERQKPGNSALYNAFTAWSDSTDCAAQAKNTGMLFTTLLNYKTPDAVFYEEVNFSLLDQLA
jgi:hypothetical protein